MLQEITFSEKRRDDALLDVEHSHKRALANVQLHVFLTRQDMETPSAAAGSSVLPARPCYYSASEGPAAAEGLEGAMQYCPPASPSDSSFTLLEVHDVDAVLIAAAVRGVVGCPVLPEPALRVNAAQLRVSRGRVRAGAGDEEAG